MDATEKILPIKLDCDSMTIRQMSPAHRVKKTFEPEELNKDPSTDRS
ncbi:hypothetical protein [Sphingobacterium sp. 1.A.5]|nr:hypothetical protein [Sphingobacterium sp. 1.A.5]